MLWLRPVMTTVVTSKGRRVVRADRSGVRHHVAVRGAEQSLAFPERDHAAPGGVEYGEGGRSYVLWADRNRQTTLATVRTHPTAGKRHTVYLAYGSAGEQLATIVVDKGWPRIRRTHWTIELPGEPAIVGKKGRILWWLVWLLCCPLMAATAVASIFAPSGDGIGVSTPQRIIWRRAGRAVLDYRHHRDSYYIHDPTLDPRVVCALIALHGSRRKSLLVDNVWDDE